MRRRKCGSLAFPAYCRTTRSTAKRSEAPSTTSTHRPGEEYRKISKSIHRSWKSVPTLMRTWVRRYAIRKPQSPAQREQHNTNFMDASPHAAIAIGDKEDVDLIGLACDFGGVVWMGARSTDTRNLSDDDCEHTMENSIDGEITETHPLTKNIPTRFTYTTSTHTHTQFGFNKQQQQRHSIGRH